MVCTSTRVCTAGSSTLGLSHLQQWPLHLPCARPRSGLIYQHLQQKVHVRCKMCAPSSAVLEQYTLTERHVDSTDVTFLQLPTHILFSILQHLDVTALCAASRSCTVLNKIVAQPLLWPHFKDHNPALWDVRCTLARILRLPPQVFSVQLDVKRSRKFPVTVPLHNLRPILNITDTEGLADKVSKAVQDKVARLSASLWRHDSWQQLPPAASISICRADRATVRASLRPEAVVPRIVHQLQQIGWPPTVNMYASALGAAPNNAAFSTHMARLPPPTGRDENYNSKQTQGPCTFVSVDAAEPPCSSTDVSLAMCEAGGRMPQAPASTCGGAHDSICTNTPTAADVMAYCCQVCFSRMELLHGGQLSRLTMPACGCSTAATNLALSYATSSGSIEPHGQLAALRQRRSTLPAVMAATAGKMPDWQTARESASAQLQALGLRQQVADPHATAAARLMFVAASVDPSQVGFSLPGKPGWFLLLQQAAKAVARLHWLQHVCCVLPQAQAQQEHEPGQTHAHHCIKDSKLCVGSVSTGCMSSQQTQLQLLRPALKLTERLAAADHDTETAAWATTGPAELQLCLAGFTEFSNAVATSRCIPATLFKCLVTLEAAVTDYASSGHIDGLTVALHTTGVHGGVPAEHLQSTRRAASILKRAGADDLCAMHCSHHELVQVAMHVEALRCMQWVFWLLGIGYVRAG